MTMTVIWAVAIAAFIVLALISVRREHRDARAGHVYCTKHVRRGTYGTLVRTLGGHHRTPGPDCDGPEHRVVPLWW